MLKTSKQRAYFAAIASLVLLIGAGFLMSVELGVLMVCILVGYSVVAGIVASIFYWIEKGEDE